ncbi:MAG: nuclear transport factor 2 family protein [Pseudomonadota bacterium]
MTNTEICAALFQAFESGNENRIRELCSQELKAQQNGGPAMGLDALIAFSSAVLSVVDGFHYAEPLRSATETGFVEEHAIRGTLPNGSSLDITLCVVGEVTNGKISEIREYVDSEAAAGLRAALA